MIKFRRKFLLVYGLVLLPALLIGFFANAGTLTPPAGSPSASFYTLSDLYNFITNNTTATEGGHSFTFSDALAGSGHTLTEIYNALTGLVNANQVKAGTTYLNVAGTLTPDGGTAAVADLFSGKTAQLTSDWTLDTGTLNLACNTSTFDGSGNLVANAYDGGGSGNNRWCMTDSGDAAAGDILSGKIAWVDGVAVTGSRSAGYTYGDNSADKVLTTASAAGTYDASSLSAGTIKNGTTFGVSLTGQYPSATYPLVSADATTDLAASGGNLTSSNGAVEWWQSDGTRQTATLDLPTLANVCANDTSNNSAGTLSVTAAYVATGNTYCGTAGTLLGSLFNGTGSGFNGGSQGSGGVDDYNNGGTVPADRYKMGWTACTLGNTYCGTNDSGADMKDDSTGLVWSLPCNGSGCSSFSDATPLTYSWSSGGTNNNSRTASQLCSDHSGWSLPHQKQMMQAYIDGSWTNVEDVHRPYWTATTRSISTTYAWYVYLSHGSTFYDTKTTSNTYYVRCVR